jgi:hypothetical protein
MPELKSTIYTEDEILISYESDTEKEANASR